MQIKIRKLPRKYKRQPTYPSFAVQFFFVFLICIFVFLFALGKKSSAKCKASPHIPAQVASNPIDLQRKKPALCQPPSLHIKSQDFSRSRPLHFKSPDFFSKASQQTTKDNLGSIYQARRNTPLSVTVQNYAVSPFLLKQFFPSYFSNQARAISKEHKSLSLPLLMFNMVC